MYHETKEAVEKLYRRLTKLKNSYLTFMKQALIVGGANGIGLAIAHQLSRRNEIQIIHIVDREPISQSHDHIKFQYSQFDLQNDDYSIFDNFQDIDTLIITAGFGRLNLFENISEPIIKSSFLVNAVGPIRIIKRFYDKLNSKNNFNCAVMVSIAGFMSSPFFSVYAATKAALKIFIESINVELEMNNVKNRVLNVSPGSIKGTSFNQGQTDLSLIENLAAAIIHNMELHNDLFIPQYNEIFKDVLERYHKDFRAEGRHSYEYKLNRL